MMMREHVLEKLDELLDAHKPYIDGDFSSLEYHLEELFESDTGVMLSIRDMDYIDGRLRLTVWTWGIDDADVDEYCAGIQDYVEGRFDVEPYIAAQPSGEAKLSVTSYPKALASNSKILGYTFVGFVIDDPAEGLVPTAEWLGDSYIPPYFGKNTRVIHPPKAKPAVKPPPPHLALYQQRGSKGKRKNW